MPVFNRLTREEIRRDFTHTGLLLGICPVYIGECTPDEHEQFATYNAEGTPMSWEPTDVVLCERNWVPRWAVPVTAMIAIAGIWLLNFGGLRPAFPQKFPLIITGEIR